MTTRVLLLGILFMFLAGAGFFFPITQEGVSIVGYYNVCTSSLGEIAQFFSFENNRNCNEVKFLTYGIMILGLMGLIFFVIGIAVPNRR